MQRQASPHLNQVKPIDHMGAVGRRHLFPACQSERGRVVVMIAHAVSKIEAIEPRAQLPVICLSPLQSPKSPELQATMEASLRGLYTPSEQYSNDLHVCLAVFYH